MANSQRMSNLTKIKINGSWIVEEKEIQEAVVSTFQHLLLDPGGWTPSVDGLVFDRLEGEEAARLEEPFSVKEVVSTLFYLSGDKVLRLDGYSLAFWQSSWDLVKEEVMVFFRDFHERGRFVRNLNSTFLVLVLKKGDVEDLRDYRPISLVGGLYELLAKALANRLK